MKHKIPALLALSLLISFTPALAAPAEGTNEMLTPELALQKLKDGNERFVKERLRHPNDTAARRVETSKMGQHPYATVLTCADSRVPVEIVFDAGVGDIFVNRIAGNIITTEMAGSIEYGVEHLHTPVLVILGHTGCGAVTAAASHGEHTPNIEVLLKPIGPAIKEAKHDHPDKEATDLIPQAIKANVYKSIKDLLESSGVTRNLVRDKKLRVEAAIYDLGTGKVEWLGQHPDQASLLNATFTDDRHIGKTPEVAIIINDTNPAENIGKTMLEMIFAGDVANWIVANGEDRPIQLVGPKRDNSAYDTFTSLVLKDRPMAPEYFDLPTDARILEEVANEPGAIAFIRFPYTEIEGVKILPVHSRLPGTYKYPLNPELLKQDEPEAKDTDTADTEEPKHDNAHTTTADKDTHADEAHSDTHADKQDMHGEDDSDKTHSDSEQSDTHEAPATAQDKHTENKMAEHSTPAQPTNVSVKPRIRTKLSDHPAHVETE